MNQFIFITTEGYTYQPNCQSSVPDIENLQVLGFGVGKTIEEALINMMKENPYINDTNFDELIGIELKSKQKTNLFLSNYKKQVV